MVSCNTEQHDRKLSAGLTLLMLAQRHMTDMTENLCRLQELPSMRDPACAVRRRLQRFRAQRLLQAWSDVAGSLSLKRVGTAVAALHADRQLLTRHRPPDPLPLNFV